MESKKDLINKAYSNPAIGLGGVEKLYQKLKDKGITKKEIQEVLRNNELNQITTSNSKINYIPIIAKKPYSYQMDVAKYDNYKTFNKNYVALLAIIEITSRKGFLYPLKSLEADEVYPSIEEFIKENPVNQITSDNGSEFINSKVQQLAKEHKIEWRFSQPGEKTTMGKVERFNKTIRDIISRWFTQTGKKEYVSIIPDILENYNSSKHRSTKMAPNDFKFKNFDKFVESQKESPEYLNALYDMNQFNIGDKVRIAKNKSQFEKGSKTFSQEIYTIVDIIGYKFQLANENGTIIKQLYKHYEMKKVGGISSKVESKDIEQEKELKLVKTSKSIKRNAKLDISPEELKANVKAPSMVLRKDRKKNPKYN
jgi:transposase InsO family protein